MRTFRVALLPYVRACAGDEAAFTARFGLVMQLDYYLDAHFLPVAFSAVRALRSIAYYAQMAAAWLLSAAAAPFPAETAALLEERTLPPFIQNKAIQKTLESRRVESNIKDYIRSLKV